MAGQMFRLNDPEQIRIRHRIKTSGGNPKRWIFDRYVECGGWVHYSAHHPIWEGIRRPVPGHLYKQFLALQNTVIPVRWWFFRDGKAVRELRQQVKELETHPDMVEFKQSLTKFMQGQCCKMLVSQHLERKFENTVSGHRAA